MAVSLRKTYLVEPDPPDLKPVIDVVLALTARVDQLVADNTALRQQVEARNQEPVEVKWPAREWQFDVVRENGLIKRVTARAIGEAAEPDAASTLYAGT